MVSSFKHGFTDNSFDNSYDDQRPKYASRMSGQRQQLKSALNKGPTRINTSHSQSFFPKVTTGVQSNS